MADETKPHVRKLGASFFPTQGQTMPDDTTQHWCTLCQGQNPQWCQFNPHRGMPRTYTTDNTGPTPAPAAQPLPLLARDIAADLGTTPLQVCIALRELGFGGYSVNMAVTAEQAAKLREHFKAAPATLAQPAMPEPVACRHCDGSGTVRRMTSHLGPDDYEFDEECSACAGTGSSNPKDAIEALPYSLHRVKGVAVIERAAVLRIIEASAAIAEARCAAMRGTLEDIKASVCGDRHPRWTSEDSIYAMRSWIADKCDAALSSDKGGETDNV